MVIEMIVITTWDKYKAALKTYAEHLYRDNKEIDDKMFFAMIKAIDEVVI